MAVPEVSNLLIYEVLKRMREQLARLQHEVRGIREEMSAIRGHVLTKQRLDEHSPRPDRIEHRLELNDLIDTPV
jgi:hypothetical protein